MSELKIEDVAKMVAVFKLNYNAYNNAKPEEIKMMVDFWYNRLKEYDVEIVLLAFDRIIKYSKYLPTLASFIEQIEKMGNVNEDSEFELWEELSKAIYEASIIGGRLGYTATPLGETKTQGQLAREQLDELFNKLNPLIKEYVVSVQGLLNLGNIDAEFEKARFLKAYPRLRERVKLKSELQPEVLIQLEKIGNKQIENKND